MPDQTPIYFISPIAKEALSYAQIYPECLSEQKQNFHSVGAKLPLSHSGAGEFPDVARDDFFHHHFWVVGRTIEKNILAPKKAHIPPIRDVLTCSGLRICEIIFNEKNPCRICIG